MRSSQGTAGAAGLLMVAMVASRLLGYLRDVLIYARFGQNNLTDAYQAAFSIPDFLYLLLVGGALSSAFIPVFAGYLATDQEEEAWKVASIVFNFVVLLMLVGIGLGLVYTPELVRLLVPGFDAATMKLTVTLTRIMFAQAFFMALSGVAMGVLYSYRYFTATAFSAVLYNLGIILVGWFFSPRLGIAAFSLGVVAGAVAGFAVQVPPLLRYGVRYHFSLNLRHPGVRRIWRLMVPVLVSLSVTQLNLFVNQNLASHLSEGLVAALRTAQRLMQLPIGTLGVALAVASFPNLTVQAARGRYDEYRRTLSLGLRSLIFLLIPASLGLIVLRVPIVRLLFEQGRFTPEDTLVTAQALLYYSLGIVAYGCIQILNRSFYALQDTATPMLAGVAAIGLNIWLNVSLVGPLGHGGLALAYSLAGGFNLLLLLLLLRRRLGRIGGRVLAGSALKSLLAGGVAVLGAWWVARYLEPQALTLGKLGQVQQVGAAMGLALVVFVLAAVALRMEEVDQVWEVLKRRLGRRS
ncbi:MAG: murein biosynthesis integral membrane protein MurJ [Moorellales bacterium]